MSEFEKVFLNVDRVYKLDDGVFDNEWRQVRKQQIGFLLERPLMFKVLTEKAWGPQKLMVLWTNEWWEAEQEERSLNRNHEVEELADMALLFLTLDSFNPSLSLPTQRGLLKMGWDDTVKSYCDAIGLDRNDLMPTAVWKIRINELRNPPEAFMLVPKEDMRTSNKRMDHNWHLLKEKRKAARSLNRQDWWKKTLYIDENGWVREIVQ